MRLVAYVTCGEHVTLPVSAIMVTLPTPGGGASQVGWVEGVGGVEVVK